MIKRLNIYFREMFPLIPRFFLGMIVFGEIYFITLLNYGVTDFRIGIQELIGVYTVFAFYMYLRISDDFKDYETDKNLFPDRALPSGKVTKRDLFTACIVVQIIAVFLNVRYMNNLIFFLLLYGYGFLMSQWFFQRHKIQSNLLLALITHNPVQIIINLYIISFTCIKYILHPFTYITFLVMWTLYFPSLIWEISRKIRAPREETEYVTYSKLFGYKKSTKFVMFLTLIDIVTNIILVWNLNKISVAAFIGIVTWITIKFLHYMKNPYQYKIIEKVEKYTYVQESLMLLTVAAYLIVGKI